MNDYCKELVSPAGEIYVSKSPRETNDLMFGSGYREATEETGTAQESGASAKGSVPATTDRGTPASSYASGGEVSP